MQLIPVAGGQHRDSSLKSEGQVMLLGKDISKTEIGHAAVTLDELHDRSYDDGVVV